MEVLQRSGVPSSVANLEESDLGTLRAQGVGGWGSRIMQYNIIQYSVMQCETYRAQGIRLVVVGRPPLGSARLRCSGVASSCRERRRRACMNQGRTSESPPNLPSAAWLYLNDEHVGLLKDLCTVLFYLGRS